jgi:hypothetical protein
MHKPQPAVLLACPLRQDSAHAAPANPAPDRLDAAPERLTTWPCYAMAQAPAGQRITSGPASKAANCQGEVGTETATTGRSRTTEYAAFVRRAMRAYSRVGDGDVEALVLLVGLAEEIDAAMAEAVTGLRAHGYSWAEIGARLGISHQAAQQR